MMDNKDELTFELQKALAEKEIMDTNPRYKDIQDIEDYFNALSEEEKKQNLECL